MDGRTHKKMDGQDHAESDTKRLSSTINETTLYIIEKEVTLDTFMAEVAPYKIRGLKRFHRRHK